MAGWANDDEMIKFYTNYLFILPKMLKNEQKRSRDLINSLKLSKDITSEKEPDSINYLKANLKLEANIIS